VQTTCFRRGKIAPVKISPALKAMCELGPKKLGLFALYRVGLRTGYFRWKMGKSKPKNENVPPPSFVFYPILHLPGPDAILETIGSEGLYYLKAEADEIVTGRVRLFGGQPVPLNLTPPDELSHWTDYAYGKSVFPDKPNSQSSSFPIPDIKYIWEPARFGWTFTLGRAYHLTRDERYSEAFWGYFEMFQQANPVNQGPNWESAQEVALRLIALTFAAQIFAHSVHATSQRQSQITQAIADHANRIPPTLIYARAQNNNHLLSEAAGLITAALALPEHPKAQRWSKLGWKWFQCGLQTQIDDEGAYMQQSTNYHRLVLQLALWVSAISGDNMKPDTWYLKFKSATRWLLELCDRASGHVPNLGPNDGAYILPLTVQPFEDYRPVLQAAAHVFLGEDAFKPGLWDEMKLWLQIPIHKPPVLLRIQHSAPSTLHTSHSWAYLRGAKFHDRPGHADQLHLDLWWRGLNVAQDAGTYLYNADPPWDNALTQTAVHNTVMVDNRQQMTPAGRFLYLDRAQAEVLEREQAEDGSWERIVTAHDGYRRLGMMHIRSVTAYQDDRWLIEDRIQSLADDVGRVTHLVRLHWLLPDWEFEVQNVECGLQVESPHGKILLTVKTQAEPNLPPATCNLQLARTGELLHGTGEISPTWGWVSPTYGVKQPALSFSVTAVGELPLTLTSEWSFPHE